MFSQYAQDPLEGFSEIFPTTVAKKSKPRRREKTIQTNIMKKQRGMRSFVMRKLQRRGTKLIKISVLDLSNDNIISADSENDNENVILKAQYIVIDAVDNILDETESLVRKISKSLIDYDDVL